MFKKQKRKAKLFGFTIPIFFFFFQKYLLKVSLHHIEEKKTHQPLGIFILSYYQITIKFDSKMKAALIYVRGMLCISDIFVNFNDLPISLDLI